jgi:hypothetical protein
MSPLRSITSVGPTEAPKTEVFPTSFERSVTSAEISRSEATAPSLPPPHARVRYTVTEARYLARESSGFGRPITGGDVKLHNDLPRRDEHVSELARNCSDLIERMLETEDVIERENDYRTLEVSLSELFERRPAPERAFGQLVSLLMGVTKHTTSEFFTKEKLIGLKRAVDVLSRPTVVEGDLREARRALVRSGLDPLRPFRGVFEDV